MGGLETSLWMKSFKPIFLSLIKAETKKNIYVRRKSTADVINTPAFEMKELPNHT